MSTVFLPMKMHKKVVGLQLGQQLFFIFAPLLQHATMGAKIPFARVRCST
jgi:hypothetical protein